MRMPIKRTFQPLEEWIYLKIYINPISSNLVLSRYILEIVKDIYPTISPKWFFLRYRDPHYHLRLRFWIPNGSKIYKGMKIIHYHLKKAMDDGYVRRWSIDGYEREIERYCTENMVVTEDYFCISSNFWINAVWEISNNDYITNCLVLSIMHITLTNFLPNLEERLHLCERNIWSLSLEFGLSEHDIRSLNEIYRRYRKFTDSLTANIESDTIYGNVDSLFKEYKDQLESLINKMDIKMRSSINIMSIVHLEVNRAYEIEARRIEMVLYYILYKTYNSEKYRIKALDNIK